LLSRLSGGGSSRNGIATNNAVRLALDRARASGITSPFNVSHIYDRIGVGLAAERLAASLLVPIGDRDLKRLFERAWPNASPEGNPMEDTSNVN